MLYYDDTTPSEAHSPASFGDVVDPAPLRAALNETGSLVTLCDTEVMASFMKLEHISRLVDALKLRLFREISSRSPDTGPSLARDHGHKDALDLLVRLTGASRPEVRARLELASVLPVAEPGWASSSPDFPESADPGSAPAGGPDASDPDSDPSGSSDSGDPSGDLPPPGSSGGSSSAGSTDTSDSADPASPEPEPLFSYVAKGIQAGELPEKTAMKITQEIRKFQKETTNTTPEQILHAEKLLVAQAVGADIPDDKTQDFVLDFDFGLDPHIPGAGESSTPAGDTSDTSGTNETGDSTRDTSGDTQGDVTGNGTGDTTTQTPSRPSRPSRPVRPNLPLPSSGVGRAATNVLKKIAPTSKRVEKEQTARRCVKLGRNVDGLVQISGWVLPEVAALMQRAFDVLLSPRTTLPEDLSKTGARGETGASGETGIARGANNTNTGVRFTKAASGSDTGANPEFTVTDDRTPDQKRHDAFAALMEAALKTGHLPQTANGAATLVVTISEEELAKPDGTGRMIDHFGKETPITARTARHTACNGKIMLMKQTRTGRIVDLVNYQRVFTEHQRKAIIARDGGCVIPGCEVPAGWCEIHHVIPWAESQVTDVNQGASLCWFHHRTIETSGWNIRMRDGVPEIKAPPGIDPEQKWRRSRPRVPEHAIILTQAPVETELYAQETTAQTPTAVAPNSTTQGTLDWGTFQTEEPF